jgi:hypothetical protein
VPNRILRDGILTSKRVNLLKSQAEVFYRRLHSVVDDFGRYTADPCLLRSACYPRKLDEVREADILRWLAEVQTAELIVLYAVEDEHYLEVLDFRQQRRAQRSKFPPPPEVATQMHSTCIAEAEHLHPEAEARDERREAEARDEGERERATAPAAPTPPAEEGSRRGRGPTRGASKGGPTEGPTLEEWALYAAATWPDWPEHKIRAAWSHYDETKWAGVKDWRKRARTCHLRFLGDGPAPRQVRPDQAPAPPRPHHPPSVPPDLVPEDTGAWAGIREGMRRTVDERDFETWLADLRQVGEPNGRLVLWTSRGPDFLPWLRENFGAAITAAARASGLPIPEGVEFRGCS